jgi:hypothetical protein
MALSKIDVANMLTGATPVANGGTALTSGFKNGVDPRPDSKPLVVNGNMNIAQRGTSFTHANSNNNEFPVDRFQFVLGSIGAYTSTQETLTSGAAYNAGFREAARIDTTTAVASPDAGDYFWFQYIMEAQDCLVFKKGTSSAEKMTVAFWVKSNKTGTGQLTVKDSDNDRQVAGTYAISSADTWEHKVINLPADTTGAMNNDNGAGFRFEWWLGAGSSYSSGAVPTAWEARADGDRGVSTLAINDNTANDWAITGVQVEVGEYSSTTLPPFQHEDFGDNLARCQRYFQKVGATVVFANHTGGTLALGATNINPMRANPTASTTGALTVNDNGVENFTQSSSNINLADGNNEAIEFGIDNFSGMTNRRVMRLREGGEDITLDAEL